MVRRRLPRSVQQFHTAKFVERNATPVLRRSRRFQAGFAFSAVLIAKHSGLPILVPSQPVRTKPTVAIIVVSRHWPPAFHGRAHNPVNIGYTPSAARSRTATHTPPDYSRETTFLRGLNSL